MSAPGPDISVEKFQRRSIPRATSPLRSPRAWAALISVVVVGVGVDLVSKRLAFERVADSPVRLDPSVTMSLPPSEVGRLAPPHEPVTVIPYALEFQLVLNPGAVFGMGQGQRWLFIGFTVAAVGFAMWIFARWTDARQRAAHAAIGLVLAGGLGNLYDRIIYGVVRDFLHPLPNVPLPFGLTWPGGAREVWPWVSNVADALLLVGIALLLVQLWRDPNHTDETAHEAAEHHTG